MQPIKSLNGTFEGNGYTISGLTLDSAVDNAIGLIAKLEGEVRNLKLDAVNVALTSASWTYAGTLVGKIDAAKASIRNCSVSGTLSMPASSSSNYAGGLLGGIVGNINTSASVVIENCVSNVAVSSGSYPGGIIGQAYMPYASVNLNNCAVLGNVSITSPNGNGAGIIGWLYNAPVEAERVYFGGKITGGNNYGFAFNRSSSGTIIVNEVYYDKTQNRSGSSWSPFELYTTSKLTGTITGKPTEEMKALTMEGFTAGGAAFDNYPVPTWLTTLDTAAHTVTVTAEGASKVSLSKDGTTRQMQTGENGTFTDALAAGQYSYTAETTAADKDNATGTLIVGKTDKAVTITLPYKVADTEITVAGPEEAVLKVYQGSDATGTPMTAKSVENGVHTYALKAGSYYYEATAEEYETASGTFTVPAEDNKVTVTMTASQKYDVTFDISSGEKTPNVKVFRGEKIYQAKGGTVYALCSGDYSYEVTAEDCITKTGKFKVEGEAKTVTVTLDGVTGDGSAAKPFVIDSKEALVYFAQQVNSGVKKYVEGHVKLSGNIDLQDMSWTPIGPSWTSPFRGHFDGAGHTISGLNVTKARTYYGFFGCLDNATVEKLTLKGQVYCAEPYARVGGLAGYAIGDVTIRNCGSAVNVSALARGCEGVGGLVGGYEDGIEYKWEDHKMVIENAYNAGNVVCTGTDANATIGGLVGGNKNCVQLKNCYNAGTVYGPGVQAAGLLGNAGWQTGDNCKSSMKGCYNAGQVVGAEGKAFGLYGKGTIEPANLQDCYVEARTAADTKPGTTVVSDDTRQDMLAKLGNGWTIDKNKNNGKPYLSGTEPVAADPSLVDELGKYADTITVSANAAVGDALTALKTGVAAATGITVAITQSNDDIQKGYLTAENHTLKLLKKNESGAAVTETATLTLTMTKGGITLSKPISVVIYPAAEKLRSLIDTIANTYTAKSDEWVVFDMAAYAKISGKSAKTSDAAKENYLNLTINALAQNNALASDRAKGELILGALGIDTTKLTPYGGGQAYNNAAKLQAMNMNVSYYTAPWILLADEQSNVGLTTAQVQQLVKILTDNQGANGLCQGAYWGKTYDDIDTTGTALAALARFAKATEDPYGVKTEAEDFIKNALTGLAKAQGENGSFGNVNTDAMVIAGLAAIGKNPSNFKNNNSSLADALTLYVNEGQNGFSSGYAAGTAGEKAQALATEQGFRALVVLEKLKEANVGMYNIYTGKTSVAENPQTKPELAKTPASASGVGTPENSTSTSGGATTSGQNIIAAISICPDSKTEWLSTTHTLAEGSTAADLIVKALNAAGMQSVGAGSGYVKSVTKGGVTLAEKDKGPNSGWMYTVNGKSTQAAINGYTLKTGDMVKLYYVEDYTKDAGSSGWAPAAPGGEQKPEDQNKDKQTAEEPKDEETKDDAAKVKALTGDLGLKARSVKTAKGHIKVRLLADAKMQAAIKELQDMGYTVKYRFYRSTKKAAAYRSAVTKKTASYTNTSGKKGVKYFYKVQLRVYDENGKLIAATALKQCQYAARSWTK